MKPSLFKNDWYEVRALSARVLNEKLGEYTNYGVLNLQTGVIERLTESLPEAVYFARIMCRDLNMLLDADLDESQLSEDQLGELH